MRRNEIIDRERRWALPAAIAAFGVFVFVVASVVVSSGAEVTSGDRDAELLLDYDAAAGTLILAAILNGVGFALVAPPLAYLFKAAQARSEKVRRGLIGIVVAGPLFLGAAIVIQSFALESVAADFVATEGQACPERLGDAEQDDCVEDLIAENGAMSIAGGLTLAGSLGLVVGLVYTSLHAMRVGLLTRFVGTLGMAVGAASLFFGPLFVVLFMFALGLLYLGAWPGGRPPAWDAGEAIPWPSPGERRTARDEEEPVEGRAAELFPDAAARAEEEEGPDEPRPEPGSIADEVARAGGDERPQKRKRRR